jgi:DNA-binding winged helix-turn-helix (wHTH) protein
MTNNANMQEFLINGCFLVNPAMNQVTDTRSGQTTRLEPRIMELLKMLAANAGTLVTRETLVKDIWNDYGGADEGLTQAVSFLRKVLDDSLKMIIKTVPKKGYLLDATITLPEAAGEVLDQATSKVKIRFSYLYPAIGVVVIIAVCLYVLYFPPRHAFQQPASVASTEVAFPGNLKQKENHLLTTITTTDSCGNRYRLVMIGDRRPKFYVNDSLQLNQEPYDALIDNLARELWKRQKEAEKK